MKFHGEFAHWVGVKTRNLKSRFYMVTCTFKQPPSCCCLKESTKKDDICPTAWSKFANFSPRLRVKNGVPFSVGSWVSGRSESTWPLGPSQVLHDAGGSSCRSNLPRPVEQGQTMLGKPGKSLSEQTRWLISYDIICCVYHGPLLIYEQYSNDQ